MNTIEIKKVLLKRGNTAQSEAYTGLLGEVTIDTDLNCLRIHNGVTPGGEIVASTATTIQGVVNDAIAGLLNGAPEALDTLKELADALGNNSNSITDILTTLATKADLSYVNDVNTSLNAGLDLKANTADLTGLATEDYVNTAINGLQVYDQSLNTTDNVTFGSILTNTITSPETGNNFNIEAGNVVKIIADSNNNGWEWQFGNAGEFILPGDGVTIDTQGVMDRGQLNIVLPGLNATEPQVFRFSDEGGTGELVFPDGTRQGTAWDGTTIDLTPGATGLNVNGYMFYGAGTQTISAFWDHYYLTNVHINKSKLPAGFETTVNSTWTLNGIAVVSVQEWTTDTNQWEITLASNYNGAQPAEFSTVISAPYIQFPDSTQMLNSDGLFAISQTGGVVVAAGEGQFAKIDPIEGFQVQTKSETVIPGQSITADDNQGVGSSDFITVWIEGSGGIDYPEITAVQPGWTVTGPGLTNDVVTNVETITYSPGMSVYKITTTTTSDKNGYTYTFTGPSTNGINTNVWTFDNSGMLTIPGGIAVPVSDGLTLASNFDVRIVTDYTDNDRTWTFNGTDGSITFPDSTTQTTAWTGSVSYNDLTNKPNLIDSILLSTTLPSGNGSFDINRVGSTVELQYAPADVPTNVSELTNDAGYVAGTNVTNIVTLTQAEYDAITPNASTVYFIVG